MTRNDYAHAYQAGFHGTVRLLVSQGFPAQRAEELSQEAWARGWESLSQLPGDTMVRSWVNFIALNLARQGRATATEATPQPGRMVLISSESEVRETGIPQHTQPVPERAINAGAELAMQNRLHRAAHS